MCKSVDKLLIQFFVGFLMVVVGSGLTGCGAQTPAAPEVPVRPTITSQPSSQAVNPGQLATFSVVASGALPLTYQWRKNGTNISGAISSSFTIPPAALADSGAIFDVVVSNAAGSVTSSAAILTLNGSPVITTQPASQAVLIGQVATFSVMTNLGALPLSYQWQTNNVNISGAILSSYSTPAATVLDGGEKFTVVVTNSLGSVTSSAATLTVNPAQPVDVVTYHNDNGRTGQNVNEVILTPANVSSGKFGKIGFFPVDGSIDAQPLYLSNVSIPAKGMHDVVYIPTEHDSVYAFDATTGETLWQVSLLGSGETPSDNRGCSQVTPEIGVTSTPVIDRTRGPHGTIYLVAMSKDGSGKYYQRIHALDITSGAELSDGPQTIQATFPGTGDNSDGHNVIFDPAQYQERVGLLLSNGVVYTGWASHCDHRPYTGWVIGFDAAKLSVASVLNLTPNGSEGAIWASGAGLAADAAGNVYFLDGNGTFDSTLNSSGFPMQGDFGNAFLKLSTSPGLTVADYFEVSNQSSENSQDVDLGSGGALLLPDITDGSGVTHHLAVGAGKDANIYVVNRDFMGKFDPNKNNVYQEIGGALPGGIWSMPAYFNGTVYFGPVGHPMVSFPITNGLLSITPSSQTNAVFPYPGATPGVSANGISGGIIWSVENRGGVGVLHAYNASNLAIELYNSSMVGPRDQFSDNKFITPTIANGKVYVGTTNGVGVFGLFP